MRISAPIVLLNGVCIYDVKKQIYLDACYFQPDTAGTILKLMEELRKNVFVFTLPRFAADEQNGNQLVVYYHDLYRPSHAAFYEERKPFCQFKKFVCLKHYRDLPQDKVIYFSTNGPKEEMVELQEKIQRIPNVTTVLYVDRYDESVYFLEWFSKDGSKKNAVQKLARMIGAKEIVSFGDNTNDLGMFSVSNRCYAVENAVAEAKAAATKVIGPNTQESVARFLYDFYMK